jgi:hypothetical protein
LLKRTVLLLVLSLCPAMARAQSDMLSPSAFSGLLDVRASYADGEHSWLDGGLGKTRVSGDDPRLAIGEADLAWRPHFNFEWSAVVEGEIQPDHDHGARIGEAYLAYKPLIGGGWHASARAGLMYPPISMENSGPFWTPTETITPSAINSWVGEEVKVTGVEGSLSRDFGEQSVGVRIGAFGFNDTAGTLLAARGWSLDDVRTNAGGHYNLPQLSAFLNLVQPPSTTPVIDIDHRVGFYGRVDWSPNSRLALNAFYYDNRGEPTAENNNDLWAWNTRFLNVGASYDVDDKTRILSQVMTGNTRMGFSTPKIWVNTDFSAAYLLATHKLGRDSVTARADVFSTTDHTSPFFGLTQENGWALTADYRKYLTSHVSGLVEVLHVESDRPGRTDVLNEAARQTQTVLQGALRLSF